MFNHSTNIDGAPSVCEKGDAVVSEMISCLVKFENELASGIIVFGDSRNLSPSFVLTILASLLIGFILTCHRKTPSKWWDRIPPSGSLPSQRKRGLLPSQHPSPRPDGRLWFILPWHCPSCAWTLNPGEGQGYCQRPDQVQRPTPGVLAWAAVT